MPTSNPALPETAKVRGQDLRADAGQVRVLLHRSCSLKFIYLEKQDMAFMIQYWLQYES